MTSGEDEATRREILDAACLVIAHPDDEILWFSSIVEDINRVIFCFVESQKHPEWTQGRRAVLRQYPLKNIFSLDLKQADVFNQADWGDPVTTQYGLALPRSGMERVRYSRNYDLLQDRLREILADCRNVFTHSPWGEYGHEEHIQIYRVVSALQDKLGFRVWFPNYCSNKSVQLMLDEVSESNASYVRFPTNKALAMKTMNLYQMAGCWTWYEDFKWFDDETFISLQPGKCGGPKGGHLFPINMLLVNRPSVQDRSWKNALPLYKLASKLSRART